MRDILIELIKSAHMEWLRKEYDHETDKNVCEYLADHLLANSVAILPEGAIILTKAEIEALNKYEEARKNEAN